MNHKVEWRSFIAGMLLVLLLAVEIYHIMELQRKNQPVYVYTDLGGFNVTWDKDKSTFIRLHLTQWNNTIVTIDRPQVGEIRVEVKPAEINDHPYLHAGKI